VFCLDDHRSRLRELAAQLAARLSNRREIARLLVRGSAGSGRRTLLAQLATSPGVVAIEPPGLADLDAALSGLVQAASPLPAYHALIADRRAETDDLDQDMFRRAEATGKALAAAGKAVALLVPHSWSAPSEDADAIAGARRARAFVDGLAAAPDLPILILGAPPPGSRAPSHASLELSPLRLDASEIDLAGLRGALRAAGEHLVGHLRTTRADASPLELRLRLGLIALGCAPAHLDGLRLVALAGRLARRLSRAQAIGLRRLLLARRPLEPAAIEPLTELHGDDLALVATCVAHGGDRLQVAEPARTALIEHLDGLDPAIPRSELEAGHRILAEHYHAIEGAARIDGLPPPGAVAWLEKLHHLAHGGAATADAWRAQRHFARELLWARARAASRAHDHEQAARLYRDSLGPFGDHPYAHHHYALNLELSHDDPELIEHHHRDAVTFDPENPWWNARLVTSLIARGAHDKARQAWRDATDRVDPAGHRVQETSRLALHLHLPIARQWLAAGQIADARAVLDDVPPRHLRDHQPLAQLAREIADAEKSDADR